MNFLCSCCKSRITNDKQKHYMIEGAGIHNIGYHLAWVECAKEELSLPPDKRQWVHTNQVPVVGERRILKVTAPFDEEIGDTFTTVFEPWQMFLNGWDSAESPEDIGKACAVLCRFDEVLCLDDYSAIISVTVLKTIPLDQLYKVIPETETDDRFYEEFGDGQEVWTEYEDEHLLYRAWTAQGDVSQVQLICTDGKGTRHEVLTSWYAMHDDYYYFGNRINKPLETGKSQGPSRYSFLLREIDNGEKSEARIAYLEQKYGIVFPDILKDLYSKTDCSGMRTCYIEIDYNGYEVCDLVTLEDEAGGFEQLVDGIYRTEPMNRYIPDDWFPLAEDEGGDHFFWSSKTQQVYYVFSEDLEDKELIADSIEEFIDMLNEYADTLPPEPVSYVAQANGCECDITEQWDNCLIDRCVNKDSLKKVVVPSEFNGNGITDIYFPGADTVGIQSFKKVPYATVHFSASRMKVSYGPDYEYTLASLCVPAKVVFDLP